MKRDSKLTKYWKIKFKESSIKKIKLIYKTCNPNYNIRKEKSNIKKET
jgi:hypothetical protein